MRGCAIILGTLLGGALGFLGTFGDAPGFLGTFLGYSRIFGYFFGLFSEFSVSFFGVKFDFFQNNPDFGVLILIFYQ